MTRPGPRCWAVSLLDLHVHPAEDRKKATTMVMVNVLEGGRQKVEGLGWGHRLVILAVILLPEPQVSDI